MSRARARYEITAEDKSKRAFDSVKKRIGGVSKGLGSLKGSIAGVVGVGGFAAMIKGGLDSADAIQKLSIKTGASTEFLSEMRGVADLAGTSFQTFSKSLNTQAKAIAEAADGTKTYAEAFDRLGLNAAELMKLPIKEQYLAIGDALKAVKNDTERAAIAQQIWGSRGLENLQITQQGTKAIRAQMDEQKALGRSLSRDQVDAAAAANDAMTKLQATISGLGESMAIEFAGPIADGAEALKERLVPALKGAGSIVTSFATALGGMGAAAAAVFRGDFAEALDIAKMTAKDFFAGVKEGGGNFVDGLAGRNGPSARAAARKAAAAGDPRGTMAGEFRLGDPVKTRSDDKMAKKTDETNKLLRKVAKNTARGGFAIAG